MKTTSSGVTVCSDVFVCEKEREKKGRMGDGGRRLGQWDSLSNKALTRNSTWLLGNRTALLHILAQGEGGFAGLQHVCVCVCVHV